MLRAQDPAVWILAVLYVGFIRLRMDEVPILDFYKLMEHDMCAVVDNLGNVYNFSYQLVDHSMEK